MPYEQPQDRPRSQLDSARPPPNTRSCGTQPAHISPTTQPSHAPRGALLTQQERPAHAGLSGMPLDNPLLHIKGIEEDSAKACAVRDRQPVEFSENQ